jgi:PKD repeat protein
MKILQIFLFSTLLVIAAFNLPGKDFVTIGATPGYFSDTTCHAEFTVLPDSLTSFPFYYHFNDLSTGDISSWSWDFGDGNFSSEKNPSHQYGEAGTYQVCLTVSSTSLTGNCTDQACLEVATLTYFSLGGLVYAGEYPLNNPVMSGDTGIASLYRIVNQQIVFVEDSYFQEYGYYWFGYLFPGEYIVKIGLTQGSPHYNNYFTTYYGDEISWTKAPLVTVSNADIYEAEVNLFPVRQMAPGQGVIKGYVNFEQGDLYSMPPVSQTTVILSDANYNPLIFTRPNSSGYFEFTGIPFSTYKLGADATGKPSSTVNIVLSQATPVVEGINLTVFGSNTSQVPEGPYDGIALISLFPNPVRDNLYIKFYAGVTEPAGIRISDATGRIYHDHTETVITGPNEFVIDTSAIPPGLYFLTLQLNGSYRPVVVKFIK